MEGNDESDPTGSEEEKEDEEEEGKEEGEGVLIKEI